MATHGGEGALVTDSSIDLPADLASELGLEVLPFSYVVDGVEHLDDLGRTVPHAALYEALRAGAQVSTAQLSREGYVEVFRRYAQVRQPVLYLALSSGLSGAWAAATTARDHVREEFPDADIAIVDTKAASVAEGLLAFEAALKRRAGATLAEVAVWVEHVRARLHGYFTVADVEYLRRGGRVPGLAAAAASVLDVKPVLELTREGRLKPMKVVRGRHRSIVALADLFVAGVGESASRVFIAHGDCAEEAAELAALVRERGATGEVRVFEAGPVIGAHGGPGWLGLAFFGRPRE